MATADAHHTKGARRLHCHSPPDRSSMTTTRAPGRKQRACSTCSPRVGATVGATSRRYVTFPRGHAGTRSLTTSDTLVVSIHCTTKRFSSLVVTLASWHIPLKMPCCIFIGGDDRPVMEHSRQNGPYRSWAISLEARPESWLWSSLDAHKAAHVLIRPPRYLTILPLPAALLGSAAAPAPLT